MSFTVDQHVFGPTSYRKIRPDSVSFSRIHSQRHRLAFSQPAPAITLETFNNDIMQKSEKEILQALNDRFASYIDKVRNLEMHNRNLEAEAAALRQSQAGRALVGEHFERELGDLRGFLQQLTGEKARTALEHKHLNDDIQQLQTKLEDEARNREELEAAVHAMKKHTEESRLTGLELDKKLHALQEEAVFLKKNHEEDVAELLAQIQGAQVSFDMRDTLKVDVTNALREIRSQLDSHASKSSTHAEEWFKVRMENLSEAARSNQDAIRGSQEEIKKYRRQLQSRTIELETLQGIKESLERQCIESEDRHHDDRNSLQETINLLDNELKTTKWQMASQLKDYQDLLNMKTALDIEIAAYRKLLEGEENHFVSGGDPYSYLESSFSSHMRVRREMPDVVIVEEQTEEVDEEEEEEKKEEEEEAVEEEEAKESKEGEGEEGEDKEEQGEDKEEEEGEEEDKKEEEEGDKGDEEEEAGEEDENLKSLEKSPAKSPAGDESKSPAKSPEEEEEPKAPASKSPVAKSPASQSPESKSPPPKSPETKSPENETAKPVEEEPEGHAEEVEKPEAKKESEADKAPKKDEASKPLTPTKPAEEKPAPESEPKESVPPVKEEKLSAPKSEKAEVEETAIPKAEPEKAESKKEDKE